jgi:hypothetical protein
MKIETTSIVREHTRAERASRTARLIELNERGTITPLERTMLHHRLATREPAWELAVDAAAALDNYLESR